MDTVTIVLLVRQILVMQQYIYHLSFLLHFVRFTEDKCSYIVRFYKFDIIYEKFLLIVRYEASEFVFFFHLDMKHHRKMEKMHIRIIKNRFTGADSNIEL